ncbi:DUF1189 family protein [Candidatus Roizmanbacteria bacterium]|nr:DUF1189 family protein [Candidatus Roizmanbacteria bacterium]
MKKVKGFLAWYRESLLPQYPFYHRLLKKRLRISLLYGIAMILVSYYTYISIYIIVRQPIQSMGSTIEAVEQSLHTYPSDLVIRIQKGVVFSNYDRPYFLWATEQGKKRLLAVLDTSADAWSIHDYQSELLLTGHQLILASSHAPGYDIISLNNATHVINKASVGTIIKTIELLKVILPYCYLLLVFVIIPLVLLVMYAGTTLLIALISYGIAHYFFSAVQYKRALQLTIHASTLPFAVFFGVHLVSSRFIAFPLLILLFLAFSLTALYEAYGDHASFHRGTNS